MLSCVAALQQSVTVQQRDSAVDSLAFVLLSWKLVPLQLQGCFANQPKQSMYSLFVPLLSGFARQADS